MIQQNMNKTLFRKHISPRRLFFVVVVNLYLFYKWKKEIGVYHSQNRFSHLCSIDVKLFFNTMQHKRGRKRMIAIWRTILSNACPRNGNSAFWLTFPGSLVLVSFVIISRYWLGLCLGRLLYAFPGLKLPRVVGNLWYEYSMIKHQICDVITMTLNSW